MDSLKKSEGDKLWSRALHSIPGGNGLLSIKAGKVFARPLADLLEEYQGG